MDELGGEVGGDRVDSGEAVQGVGDGFDAGVAVEGDGEGGLVAVELVSGRWRWREVVLHTWKGSRLKPPILAGIEGVYR